MQINNRKWVALFSLGASVGALVASAPACAQQSSGAQAEAPQGAERVEEIVVSAQKRQENLQKVPITITAITSTALEAGGIKASTDLTQVVPNLNMYQQATSVTPFIRGVGTKNSVVGDENAVALYVDGVYISSAAASVFSLANIERIEVLKGPQGTLFGRNATAGVIQVITRDPSETPSVNASIGYGNYDTVEGSFYGTTGVARGVATDLSVYYMNQHDGWGKNLYNGKDVHKGRDFSIRNKWVLNVGDSTKISLAGDYDYQVPIFASIYRAREGQVLVSATPFAPSHPPTPYPGFYNVDVNMDDPGNTEQWGLMGKIEHDFGPVRLVGITSYRDLDAKVRFDDGSPGTVQHALINQKSRNWSQEIQLASDPASPIKWIGGLYYYHDLSQADPFRLILLTASGLSTSDRYNSQKTDSYAAFGQVTIPATDRLNLTAGLRYTIDKRTVSAYTVDPATGIETPVARPAGEENGVTFRKLTWRFALDYQLSDHMLGYAAASRGFKSGVYNLFGPSQPAARPQTLDTYEVGLKTDLFDRRLRFNLAAFYNDFRDIQLQVPVVGGTQLLNAAKGRSQGVEIEIQAVPVENLSLTGSVGYLDSKYTDFPNAPFFIPNPDGSGRLITISGNAKGRQFLIAPNWTANISLRYAVPTEIGKFSINVSEYYNGGFYFDVENRVPQKSYNLVNATLAWEAPDRHFGAELWVKNLTASRYLANSVPGPNGDQTVPGAPRTFGGRLKFNF